MLDGCGHGVSSALISAVASQGLQAKYELSANASEAVQPGADFYLLKLGISIGIECNFYLTVKLPNAIRDFAIVT